MKSFHRLPLLAVALVLATSCGDDGPVQPKNRPPRIHGLVAFPTVVPRGGTSDLTVLASDPDNDTLTYAWSAPAGTLEEPTGDRTRWTAPNAAGVVRIGVVVSDGTAAESTFVNLPVGSGTLIVTSEPAGASIVLNGIPSGRVTPDTLENLPVMEYAVQAASDHFRLGPNEVIIVLGDGDTVSTHFALSPVTTEEVDMGPANVDEIGGLIYSPGGKGVLYAARAGSDTTIRSASLVPTHSGVNGRVLQAGAHLHESLSIREKAGSPAELAFVEGDSIRVGVLLDSNGDGLIEEMQDPAPLQGIRLANYGPAFSRDGILLAFAFAPSTPPNDRSNDVLLYGVYDAGLVTGIRFVSPAGGRGNALHFGPGGSAVYETGGEIYSVQIDASGASEPIKVSATGGQAIAPALSPDGRYVAFLDTAGSLRVLALSTGIAGTLMENVSSRRVAWAPNGRELLISDNSRPGDSRLLLVFNLPLR